MVRAPAPFFPCEKIMATGFGAMAVPRAPAASRSRKLNVIWGNVSSRMLKGATPVLTVQLLLVTGV